MIWCKEGYEADEKEMKMQDETEAEATSWKKRTSSVCISGAGGVDFGGEADCGPNDRMGLEIVMRT
jgi:hypothetical protein